MSRPRFGLDLDGVCYDWHTFALGKINERFGTTMRVEEWATYKPPVIPPEAWPWIMGEAGVALGVFRDGGNVQGAVESVRRIATAYDIIVITSRPKCASLDTLAWLVRNEIPAVEVHIVGDRAGKLAVQCDAYVDDDSGIIAAYAGLGRRAFLFDRPWNQVETPKGSIRVKDWSDLLGWLEL